jgi:DNA-binding response OmpR family regulator
MDLPTGSLILVVDDDPMLQGLITRILNVDHYTTITAGSAEEALARLDDQLPALIVLDIMLPSMSGLELCQQLRQNPRTAALPILMLTALGNSEDRLAGFAAGANDYMTKPFQPDELLQRVRGLLRRQ